MRFIYRRIVISVIVFFTAINLNFILPRLIPGNAAQIAGLGRLFSAQAVQDAEIRYGLNLPVYSQYFLYLKNIFATWPPYFGVSFNFYPTTVTSLLIERTPWTLLLVSTSMLLALFITIIMSVISFQKRGGKFELGSLYSSIFLRAVPGFFLAMIFIYIFGVKLHWFPLFGTNGFNPGGGLQYVSDVAWHAVLPVVSLTLVIFGQYYFTIRGAAQHVLGSDFIFAARARGVPERRIAWSYVFRNSLLPFVSLLGHFIAILISAELLVETVFGYQGLGDLIVDGVVGKDYPVVEGGFFMLTVIVILFALLGDFLMLKLDPRLRK